MPSGPFLIMASAPKHDYYETLGIPRKASADDVRKAYKKLARKFHPDVNPGDKSAEDRFKNVQEAYDILGDPKKRPMYDQYGFYSESGMPPPGPGGAAHGPSPGMDFSGFDFSEPPFGPGGGRRTETGGGFRDIFSQFFGNREGAHQPQPEKGGDLEYGMTISFWQAIRGTQARMEITRYEICGTCRGSGSTGAGEVNCPQCKGTGNVTQMAGPCGST